MKEANSHNLYDVEEVFDEKEKMMNRLFKEKLNELYTEFGDSKVMVLSTACNNKVSSRMMSIVFIDGKFYFQTDKKFRKYKQVLSNFNVALCIDNIQVEVDYSQVSGHKNE